MSLSSLTNRIAYTGNGAVDTYAYTFRIFDDDDLLVTVRNTSDVETVLTKTTDYTVTGVGETSGGNVVLVNSSQAWLDGDGDLLTNYVLVIRRVMDLIQETDIRNQGEFLPEIHEDQFDKIIMIAQQLQDSLDKAVKLPETIDDAAFDPTMPTGMTDIDNVGKALVINATADGWDIQSPGSLFHGDITIDEPGDGLVVTTPDGAHTYRIAVDNNGELTTEPVS